MLWATGVGAEVIRPMAAPVLGGLLIADEVIDVFLPVLYFAVQKWRWRNRAVAVMILMREGAVFLESRFLPAKQSSPSAKCKVQSAK